jgi:hypothetical protein
MSTTRRLARLRALTPVQRRVLGEALVLLPAACAGLKVAGMRRTRALLSRVSPKGPPAGLDAAGIARMVSIAARHGPFRARCLAASMTLESLLRRYGFEGQLRLGVRRHDGRIEAHAWIEHDGAALAGVGRPHAEYCAFEDTAPQHR